MDQLEQLETCRICVACFPLKDMDFINIFQPNVEFQQELDFIRGEIRQWQLTIQPDDGLPQRLCANCFTKFCSIDAFRKECESAQKNLIENIMQKAAGSEPVVTQDVIKNNEVLLPLVGNYESGNNMSIDSGKNLLVSSVGLTHAEVSLTDFSVYDQQFSHYDNPALMDASSTLLDTNLIAPEMTQELGFLPSQNLFTFETAEPPTTGSLPLDETDTTSIMNEMLAEKNINDNVIKQEDLEEILQHSIIPTTTKLKEQSSRLIADKDSKMETAIKKENGNQQSDEAVKANEYQEDMNSDMECDDTDLNIRLKGLTYACHYCYCPESGAIDHLAFPNEDALSQHFFDVHDPNRPYTCPLCPQSFKIKLMRDDHVRLTHPSSELHTCNYCQKHVEESLDAHQYKCQFVSNWQCENCKEKFLNTPFYRFRLHQREHEGIKYFKCRSFAQKANFEAHQRMHKAAQSQTNYTCTICKSNFLDDYELKRHKYQQHNAEAPVECNFCHKGFSSNKFLQRHINKFHTDNANSANNINNNNNNSTSSTKSSSSSSSVSSPSEQHTCLSCNMNFKTLQKLQQHLLMGRDANGNCLYYSANKQERRKLQRQGVFPCFYCPRRFHLRSQLDKHLNTHDARLRPFQCEQCVVRCRTTCELKQHVNVAHLNIKAFSCDKCGKCFGYKKDLRDHMLFHAEINVHCTQEGCDYVCKNEKALNDHIRHKHRLLSCEYCHEQFTRQKLTAHLRKIHRSEIDVQLAGESDNLYKSQLLNNNNDITQISFNLLNIQQQQQQEQQLSQTSLQSPPTSAPSEATAASSPSSLLSTSTSLLTPPSINSIAISSSPLSSCLTSNSLKGTNLSSISPSISTHNMIDTAVTADHDPHDQLCAIFANDSHHDSNGTSLALNGLVSNGHDLNLVPNEATNMFLVPPTTSSSSTSDNQFDQYFVASLIDTEQEITVT